MIRLIVADDHTLVRAGICSLLKSKDDIEVIAETESGHEAVRLCRELKPDAILLDLSMGDIDGLEATKQIISANPKIKVLILTMYENEEYATRVMDAGASGFIVKRMSPEELPDAIRKVVEGEIYITPAIMQKMILRKRKDGEKGLLSLLSDRELQVFRMITQGMTHNQISDKLCLSASTVATYKWRVMEKLGVQNNAELMRHAIRIGLIDKFD
ncbi:MAG: response regulator transcription factor [bacterium]